MDGQTVEIGLRENQKAFRPGERIVGAVRWELQAAPKTAEVRLCWFTRGKGTEDVSIVETVPLEAPQAGDTRAFEFVAPAAPHSFSGKLISLLWAVEIVLQPGKLFCREEIVIAPEAREIVLPSLPV